MIIRIKRTKSIGEILEQVDRIYRLYEQGYGSKKLLEDFDSKVYVIITKWKY